MERLTFEVHDGGMFVKESDVKTYMVEDETMHTGNAVRKLAEYEDTGITPEQVKEIDRLYAEKCRELAEQEQNNLTGVELAFVATGLKKLAEYEGLEKQGLLRRLPCRVGTTVWFWNKRTDLFIDSPFKGSVIGYEFSDNERLVKIHKVRTDYSSWDEFGGWDADTISILEIEDFGKSIFFTQQSAENALAECKEMENMKNERK